MNSEDKSVRQQLEALALFSPLNKFQLIENQGAVNRSYLISSNGKYYLVKKLVAIGKKKPDRKIQFILQTQLAEQGVAVYPRYLSPKQDLWVEDWHEKKSSQLTRSQKIDLLAETLARLHQINIECQVLPLSQDWQKYLNSMPEQQAKKFERKVKEFTPIWQKYSNQDQVFCHHDLSFDNISQDGSGLCFDWEYAARGNVFYDLASCILVNQLNQQESSDLLNRYVKLSDYSLEYASNQVETLLPLAKLTYEIWYAALENNF